MGIVLLWQWNNEISSSRHSISFQRDAHKYRLCLWIPNCFQILPVLLHYFYPTSTVVFNWIKILNVYSVTFWSNLSDNGICFWCHVQIRLFKINVSGSNNVNSLLGKNIQINMFWLLVALSHASFFTPLEALFKGIFKILGPSNNLKIWPEIVITDDPQCNNELYALQAHFFISTCFFSLFSHL